MVESLVGIEKDLFLFLNGLHTTYLDSVMFIISDRWPWIIFTLLFLTLMSAGQKRSEVLLFILGIGMVIFLADGTSSGIIKEIFQRLRPTHHPLTKDLVQTVLGHRGGGYGFVSGHSANFFAFALFSSLVIRHRLYTIAAFVTAATIAYSRIYLGMHFVTDVIPGLLLGLLCGWLSYWLYQQARVTFLHIDKRESTRSYLRTPEHRRLVALFMVVFYILIWVTAPFFFRFYS